MATQQEVGQHLDLSERQVRNLLNDGVLPAGKGRGGFDLDSCREAYIRHLRRQIRRPPETEMDDQQDSLEYQRLRLTKEQADNMQLKNEQARGNLVPYELMTIALSKIGDEWCSIVDAQPNEFRRKHPDLELSVYEDIERGGVKMQNAISRLYDLADEIVTDYAASIELK